MKKMKSMSDEAAAVHRLVLLSDEDDELNVQQEDEDSDDTIDEMEMLLEVPNRYSQEDALEKLLPLVKITRNKKIEAKNDKMMWRHCRYLAEIRYLQLRAAGEGKIKASVNAASKYYDNEGVDSYKSNRCLNFAFPCST